MTADLYLGSIDFKVSFRPSASFEYMAACFLVRVTYFLISFFSGRSSAIPRSVFSLLRMNGDVVLRSIA